MEDLLFELSLLLNVDGTQVGNLAPHAPVHDIDVDVGGLVGQGSDFVPVLLVDLEVIGDYPLLLQGHLGVFGLEMNIYLGILLPRYFDVDDTLLARLVLVPLDLLDDLVLLAILAVLLQLLQALFVGDVFARALLVLDEGETLIPDDLNGVFHRALDLEVFGLSLLNADCLVLIQPEQAYYLLLGCVLDGEFGVLVGNCHQTQIRALLFLYFILLELLLYSLCPKLRLQDAKAKVKLLLSGHSEVLLGTGIRIDRIRPQGRVGVGCKSRVFKYILHAHLHEFLLSFLQCNLNFCPFGNVNNVVRYQNSELLVSAYFAELPLHFVGFS